MLCTLQKRSACSKFAGCLIAVFACFVANTSHAQINLLPAQPENSLFGRSDLQPESSSRRQVHVSRGNSSKTPPKFEAAPSPFLREQRNSQQRVAAAGSDREREFALLQKEADAMERQLSLVRRIVAFASPTIVHIEAIKTSDPGKGFASSRIEEAGAGVLVNLRGYTYVLTNRHVIYPAELNSIRVELSNGRILRPSQVWADPSTDVAVMRVSANDIEVAKLGDSNRVGIGDFVLAVGSPFGLSHSVTYGIISAKGRRNLELGSKEIEIQDFFQTDAAINPGNSGGPLLNLRGEVVGINTAIASNSGGNEGIGFSIPINLAVQVADQLVTHGKLLRSYLGVQLDNAFDLRTARQLGLPVVKGALVKDIVSGSPAERAGLRVGDVIIEFNGNEVQNDGHLVRSVGLTPVGSTATLVIIRDRQPRRVQAVLDASPDQP